MRKRRTTEYSSRDVFLRHALRLAKQRALKLCRRFLEVLAALAEWNQGLDLPNGAERVRTTLRLAWARRLPKLQPLTSNPNPSP